MAAATALVDLLLTQAALTPALLQPLFTESGDSSGSEIATGNPLVDLLVAVQRGVLMAAGKMGEVRLARDMASVTRTVREQSGRSSAVLCCWWLAR